MGRTNHKFYTERSNTLEIEYLDYLQYFPVMANIYEITQAMPTSVYVFVTILIQPVFPCSRAKLSEEHADAPPLQVGSTPNHQTMVTLLRNLKQLMQDIKSNKVSGTL